MKEEHVPVYILHHDAARLGGGRGSTNSAEKHHRGSCLVFMNVHEVEVESVSWHRRNRRSHVLSNDARVEIGGNGCVSLHLFFHCGVGPLCASKDVAHKVHGSVGFHCLSLHMGLLGLRHVNLFTSRNTDIVDLHIHRSGFFHSIHYLRRSRLEDSLDLVRRWSWSALNRFFVHVVFELLHQVVQVVGRRSRRSNGTRRRGSSRLTCLHE